MPRPIKNAALKRFVMRCIGATSTLTRSLLNRSGACFEVNAEERFGAKGAFRKNKGFNHSAEVEGRLNTASTRSDND